MFLDTPALVEAQTVVRGATSCGAWISEADPEIRNINRTWVVGFLSGLASGTETNVLQGTDNPSIFLWMDNYCRKEPLSRTSAGARALYFELKKQKGL